MACVTVDIDVDLDEFDTEDLIDEIVRRKKELDSSDRAKLAEMLATTGVDESALDTATDHILAGRRSEALIWLERALPGLWRGRLA